MGHLEQLAPGAATHGVLQQPADRMIGQQAKITGSGSLIRTQERGQVHLFEHVVCLEVNLTPFLVVAEAKPFSVRDRDIVDMSERLIAVPSTPFEDLDSGTWATVRYAQEQERPIDFILPDSQQPS
jgi:hypothetical protein